MKKCNFILPYKDFPYSELDIYDFLENLYPNKSIYRLIGCYSFKTCKMIYRIRTFNWRHHGYISIKRILKIEWFPRGYFEIYYLKRHYRRVGVAFIPCFKFKPIIY